MPSARFMSLRNRLATLSFAALALLLSAAPIQAYADDASPAPSPSASPTLMPAPGNAASHDQAEPTVDVSISGQPDYDTVTRTLSASVTVANPNDFPLPSFELMPILGLETTGPQTFQLPSTDPANPTASRSITENTVSTSNLAFGASVNVASLAAKASATANVRLVAPASLPTGTYSLEVQALDRLGHQLGDAAFTLSRQISGSGVYLSTSSARIVDASGTQLYTVEDPAALPSLRVTATNLGDQPVTATPTLSVASATGSGNPIRTTLPAVTIPAGGSSDISAPVEGISTPGQYVATLLLADATGAPVGAQASARFSLAGESATVLTQKTSIASHPLTPSKLTDTITLSPSLDGETPFTATVVSTLYDGSRALRTVTSTAPIDTQYPTAQTVTIPYVGHASAKSLRLVTQLKDSQGTVLDTASTDVPVGSMSFGYIEWTVIGLAGLIPLILALVFAQRYSHRFRGHMAGTLAVLLVLIGVAAPHAQADDYFQRHLNHLVPGDSTGTGCCRNALSTYASRTGVLVNSRVIGGTQISGDATSTKVQSGQDSVVLYSYTVEPAWGEKDSNGGSALNDNTPVSFFLANGTTGYAAFPVFDPTASFLVKGDLASCAANHAFASIGGTHFWKNVQPSYTDHSVNNSITLTDQSASPQYYVNAQFDRHGGYVVQVAACVARPADTGKTASKVTIGFSPKTIIYWYDDSHTTGHSSSFDHYYPTVLPSSLWLSSGINAQSLSCVLFGWGGLGDQGWAKKVVLYRTYQRREFINGHWETVTVRIPIGWNYVPSPDCQPHTWPSQTHMEQAGDPNNQSVHVPVAEFFGVPMPPPNDHYATLYVHRNGILLPVDGPNDGDHNNTNWRMQFTASNPTACEVYSVYPTSTAASSYTNDNAGKTELPDTHNASPFAAITAPQSVPGSATSQADITPAYQASCDQAVTYPTQQQSVLGVTLTPDAPSLPTLTRVLTATASTASGPVVQASDMTFSFGCGSPTAVGTPLANATTSLTRTYQCAYQNAGTYAPSVTVSAAGATPATASISMPVTAPLLVPPPTVTYGRYCTGE